MRRGALLAALFLGALALRPQLVGLGPLIPSIQLDLNASHAVVGLLSTIPVLCMGLFAPPAAFLSRRLGSRHALAAALALIGVFGIARAFAPGVALLILLTIPVGIGMGLGNALLPVAVKERFADRPVFATGVYAAGINVGATVSSATAVPLEQALGDWRDPLLVFSVVTLALFVLWLVLTRVERGRVSGLGSAAAGAPLAELARLAARRRVLLHVRHLLRAQRVAARRLRRARLERGEGQARCSPC